MSKLKILLLDDDADALGALKMGLENNGFEITTAISQKEGLRILKTETFDVVVSDLKLKDGSGLEILHAVRENYPQTPVIIITAYGSVESAVEAIRSGAYDYMVKPFRLADLKRLLRRLDETIQLRKENERLRQQLHKESNAAQIVGVSAKFRELTEFARRIAASRTTVLITGETGTGKEMFASIIHLNSPRHSGPFIKINCGAIPASLMEAEMFGYEKGAFTGATRQKKGKIELADQGTLFLDEIGDLDTALQVKLLRVLQNNEFEHLGGTVTLKSDVRFIAATNSDLEKKVEDGSFREDLFYRLNVISLHVPPLREHPDDIPFLVQHFIEKYNHLNDKNIQGIEPAVIRQMLRHPWKGNVRELENMVERAVVLAQGDILKPYHFPGLESSSDKGERNLGIELGMTFADVEKTVIQKTLQYYDFDKQKAARSLQIGLATLYRKIKEYNLEKP